jgi:hypothetical protein
VDLARHLFMAEYSAPKATVVNIIRRDNSKERMSEVPQRCHELFRECVAVPIDLLTSSA